jgi:hypothetical protein
MGGLAPFFLTGANAKVVLNGKTMAFCSDLSYSVQIMTQTPKVLGMYEGSSVEPLGYQVSGSFTVIRYIKGAEGATGSIPNSVTPNDAGNGVGNWGSAWGSGLGSFLASNGVGNDGRANEALDPSTYANGVSFDIQVYQKTNGGSSGVANIKKGAAIQSFNFVALYADEDSFVANFSGQGQQFT